MARFWRRRRVLRRARLPRRSPRSSSLGVRGRGRSRVDDRGGQGRRLAQDPTAARRRLRGRGLPRLRDARRDPRDRRARADRHRPGAPPTALAAVQAVHAGGGAGPTPLDAIDDFVARGHQPGPGGEARSCSSPRRSASTRRASTRGRRRARRTCSRPSTRPVAPATRPTTASSTQTLYGALAKKLLCGAPNPAVLATIRAAQRSDGGWNFLGDQSAAPTPTSTRRASRCRRSSPAARRGTTRRCSKALGYFAAQHQASGAWQSFGADDPNSTAVAELAVTAAGFDVTSSCWRDTAVPSATRAARTGTRSRGCAASSRPTAASRARTTASASTRSRRRSRSRDCCAAGCRSHARPARRPARPSPTRPPVTNPPRGFRPPRSRRS